MARDQIKIGVDVDRETDAELRRWSKDEGRSKRRHSAVLLRKLTQVRRENPSALKQLGLAL